MNKIINSIFKLNNKESTTQYQHQPKYECLSSCSDWKLKGNVVVNKESYSLVFMGKSFYFKKPETSILTRLLSIDCKAEITKSTIKNLELENKEKSINLNSGEEFNFPINNEDFVYPILESNLAFEDNLNNIVFLEVAIANLSNSKEYLKYFNQVNNSFVDKEINFSLNVFLVQSGNNSREANFQERY